MLENWQAFLVGQGAKIENNCVLSFSEHENETVLSNNKTIICDLSHYSLYKVSGDDAISFLQGQLSNDISHVSENQSQMSSYCTPKGRAIALFRIFQLNGNLFLSLPSEIADKTLNRLKMMSLVANHLYYFVTGKLQQSQLGEFCCSSKPVRAQMDA